MTPEEEAKRIFDKCHQLIDRYKTVEVVFHHRILAKHFAVMIVDEILESLTNSQSEYGYIHYEEVKRILIEEYVYKP